jgi:hypothetical protein
MVTGGFSFVPGVRIARNMAVIRQGRELTLVNSVRLSPAGEAELEALGTPKHVVRIGFAHGADDAWMVHRFGVTSWASPGMPVLAGAGAREELKLGSCPVERAEVFTFANGDAPEAALRLDVAGGALITCDAYQNWTTFDDCSFAARLMLRAMGFGPTLIGGPWSRRMGPGVREDFDRLKEVEFKHLLSGHGTFLRDNAKAGLHEAIGKRFPG